MVEKIAGLIKNPLTQKIEYYARIY